MSNFERVLFAFGGEWELIEINHKVSKFGTNAFWDCALKHMNILVKAMEDNNVKKKVPKFSHFRRVLYKKHVPKINMKFGYVDKATGELEEACGTETPIGKYPPGKYRKVYEIASVDTSDILTIHSKVCPTAPPSKHSACLSIDGIPEASSNSVTLDIYSIQLDFC